MNSQSKPLDPAGAHRPHRRVRGGGPGQKPHPADGDLLQVRGLSGDPLPPFRAELQGRSAAGRGGGVRLL